MDHNYYKEYFHLERTHWYFRARNGLIMDHVRSIVSEGKSLRILNVGVGTGHTSELLSQFGTVTSIEYDEDCCAFVNEQTSLTVVQGSILELDFADDSFDAVCAFDVVEHVEEDALAVQELKRVCKQAGKVVITVPAYMFLWSKHDEINHHFRRYTKSQVLALFKEQGKFIYHSYYNTLLFPPVAIFRFLNNLLGLTKTTEEETGSDFSVAGKDSWLTRLLYRVFYLESFFVKRHIRLPFGVSVMVSWEKSKQ